MIALLLLFFQGYLGDPVNDLNTEFIQKLNGIRVEGCHCGRPTTVVDFHPLLQKSAAAYAYQIVKDRHFDHVDLRGRSVGQRVDRFGYPWIKIGENLGKNQVDVDQLIQDWLKSPTHCKLMMNPAFNEVGLGRHQNIWVLHMGKR